MAVLRREVVRVYRNILRLGGSWVAEEEGETARERRYIREEARRLFRKNKDLSDTEEIKVCLSEAQSRMELALHYRNPYPRPVNVAPSFVPRSKDQRGQLRRTRQSHPLYIHSQDK